MLLENGKRLPSTMEYAHSLMPIDFPEDESWINLYGMVSELGIDMLIPVETALRSLNTTPSSYPSDIAKITLI